jgi:hypothetical protein
MRRRGPKAREIARNSADGLNTQASLRRNPEIAQAWDLYQQCRQLQLVSYKTSKGKDTVLRMRTFPQGYTILPEPGSLCDQPHRLFEFFGEFMDGERFAFFNPRN